jgi:hypothetical protein
MVFQPMVNLNPRMVREFQGIPIRETENEISRDCQEKGKLRNLQSKSLVPNREISMTDSDEEEQEEQCNNVMVIEPKCALVNYMTTSAKLSSMTRLNHADVKEAAYK